MKSDDTQKKFMSKASGLYIIATPIGNLGDITLRALETIKSLDLLLCEDTRQTQKLLNHFGIKANTESYNDHNAAEKRPRIIEALKAGKTVGLVSDAGTPLISDPGYKLVEAALDEKIKVIPIPGASSVIAALSAAGLPTDKFIFLGFVEPKKLPDYKNLDFTLIFFESANRLIKTLQRMSEVYGTRTVCVAREITKLHEEFYRNSFEDAINYYSAKPPKGEVVIILSPPSEQIEDNANIEEEVKKLIKSMRLKDASEVISKKFGLTKKEVYEIALRLK